MYYLFRLGRYNYKQHKLAKVGINPFTAEFSDALHNASEKTLSNQPHDISPRNHTYNCSLWTSEAKNILRLTA